MLNAHVSIVYKLNAHVPSALGSCAQMPSVYAHKLSTHVPRAHMPNVHEPNVHEPNEIVATHVPNVFELSAHMSGVPV